MATQIPIKKNGSGGAVFYVSLVDQSNTKVFKASPTLSAGDVKLAIDDGAPANLGTLPAVDADFTKRVKVTLSQAETNGDNLTVIFSDAAGSEWCDLTLNLQTTARQIDDLAYPATSGRSLAVDASGRTDVGLIEGTDATDQIRDAIVSDATRFQGADIAAILTDTAEIGAAGAGLTSVGLATNAVDADALASDAVSEIAAGISVPSAASIATAVFDVPLTTLQALATTKIGRYLVDKLALVTSGRISVASSVAVSGDIPEIEAGADYLNADSRAFDWSTTDSSTWPDLTGATIAVNFAGGGQVYSAAGGVVTPTGATKKVRLELTDTQTAAMASLRTGVWSFLIWATLSSGSVIPLATGSATVVDRAGP